SRSTSGGAIKIEFAAGVLRRVRDARHQLLNSALRNPDYESEGGTFEWFRAHQLTILCTIWPRGPFHSC
ncbi:MAG TPA: hypothetical protein VIJ35_28470, partial [Bradyrhizobium sp.]